MALVPIEEINNIADSTKIVEPVIIPIPNPIGTDEIFRTGMFEKLQELEQNMVEEKYLDDNLHWTLKHKNDKPDIQRLVVFICHLIENGYFLPYKDVKIREFMEHRYGLKIGQNFERKRREKIVSENQYMFKEFPF